MAEVATPPGSCELNKQINRDWACQIKPKGSDPNQWMFVRGLDSISVNIETSAVDSSDMESDGWESQTKTSRTFKANIEGKYAMLNGTTVLEPSIQLLIDTGIEIGSEGEVDFRVWRTDGTDEGWESTVTNMFKDGGGDRNALRTYTSEMQSVCAPQRIKPVEKGGERQASVPWSKTTPTLTPAKQSVTVTLPNGVTGGTFTLSVGSETTAGIAHNAAASVVKSSLEALSTVSEVNVTGSATAGYKITYTGASMTADGANLTGGDSKTVTVNP